jgi:hypothetical protein
VSEVAAEDKAARRSASAVAAATFTGLLLLAESPRDAATRVAAHAQAQNNEEGEKGKREIEEKRFFLSQSISV